MTDPVIVAHGLWMPGPETKWLCRRLERAGFAPSLFKFPTLKADLSENAARLEAFAEQEAGERLDFVGYSLGGVVVLTMLARARMRRPGRVVCLGSPLRGSQTATTLAQLRFGPKVVGKSILELNREGGVSTIGARHADSEGSNREVGVIAGTRSFGLGRLVHRFAEPNDGTVAVSETKLGGISAHITLPVTHTQMLFDAEVARQAIHFLRRGRFDTP